MSDPNPQFDRLYREHLSARAQVLDASLASLRINPALATTLRQAGIESIGQLIVRTEREVMQIPGVTPRAARALSDALAVLGYGFMDESSVEECQRELRPIFERPEDTPVWLRALARELENRILVLRGPEVGPAVPAILSARKEGYLQAHKLMVEHALFRDDPDLIFAWIAGTVFYLSERIRVVKERYRVDQEDRMGEGEDD